MVSSRYILKVIIPISLGLVIALIPVPKGLDPRAWLYFALFVAVIAGVALEPIPAAAVGLIGVVIAMISGLVYTSPTDAIKWGLSGFADTTVWLIFAAFLLSLGYAKTGLGRRIALLLIKYIGKRSLGLGYAIAFADLGLAPFMPSNTARSGGTIYPIISNIPPLYGSSPEINTERRIGSYIMWVAFATTCITSSMFLTGLAPNVLVSTLASKTANVSLDWTTWFIGFSLVGFLLFMLTPILVYKIYPPEIKISEEASTWASKELIKLGSVSIKEISFLLMVILALALWIFGGNYLNATTVALLIIALMLITKIVSWEDILSHKSAWNTFVWFATLVTLADGLAKVGFISYVAKIISSTIGWLGTNIAVVMIISIFYWIHYLFASLTAHATALYPIFLTSMINLGVPPITAAYLLAYTLGIMGVLTPYATGPAPIYYGSGYVRGKDFWRLGFVFGILFYVIYIIIGVPWILSIIK
ncbi:MAG: anion permease [Sulfolobales archaeon]